MSYALGHPDRAMRPVIYLDVDDTLLCNPEGQTSEWWEKHPRGGPATHVREFLEWANANCDVRWLTFWCGRGYMDNEGYATLAERLGVPVALVSDIRNPMGWQGEKTTGINWAEHRAGRPWVWIEDEILARERTVLDSNGASDRWYYANSSLNPMALFEAWMRVAVRFGAVTLPWPENFAAVAA